VFGRVARHFREALGTRQVFASNAIYSISNSIDDLPLAYLRTLLDKLLSGRNALRPEQLLYQFGYWLRQGNTQDA
jgi:hypothetical protein